MSVQQTASSRDLPIAVVERQRSATSAASARLARVRGWFRAKTTLCIALVVADACTLVLAVLAANLFRTTLDAVLGLSVLAVERHALASFSLVPLILILFKLNNLYDFDFILAGTREYGAIVHTVTYGVFGAVAFSYFAGEPLLSRSWLVLTWVLAVTSLAAARFTARRAVRWLRSRGVLRTRVAIVGASSFGVAIAEQLISATSEGIDLVGFYDEFVPIGHRLVGNVAVIGRPSDLCRRDVQSTDDAVDEYILVAQALPHERLEDLTRLMIAREGPAVRMAVSSADLLTNGLLVAQRASVPLVTLQRVRLSGGDAVLKRGFDLLGASLALSIVALPVAFVLVRAALTGLRPLFREQHIYGIAGAPFTLRLLARGVSSSLPLRGAPALLAVLSGRMSLVGPRPIVTLGAAPSASTLSLTAVPPGLTGPWRLSGPDSSLADQALRDLAYLRNYTVWEDVRIVAQSLWRICHRRPAETLDRWAGRNGTPAKGVVA